MAKNQITEFCRQDSDIKRVTRRGMAEGERKLADWVYRDTLYFDLWYRPEDGDRPVILAVDSLSILVNLSTFASVVPILEAAHKLETLVVEHRGDDDDF